MVELGGLLNLLDAQNVMSHEVATGLCAIAYDVKAKCPNDFKAFYIGGSTVNGGAVAKSVLYGMSPQEAISDVDCGVILSNPLNLYSRQSMHDYITDKLHEIGLSSCEAFNPRNLYLVIDNPSRMANWAIREKSESYIATRFLMPFGVVFPSCEKNEMQKAVYDALSEIGKLDKDLEQKIRDQMNLQIQERRKMKEKHIPESAIREFLDQNRKPSNLRF